MCATVNKTQLVRAFILGVLFLTYCTVSSGKEREIVSLGVGDLSSVSEATARDSAIEDALRKAVEQVVGTFISSQTIVENYILLSDHIYSKSSGYIKGYKILEERKENGLYSVEVLANVGMDDIKNDLDAIGVLISRKHNPRVMIIVGESVAGAGLKIHEGLSIPETTIIDRFLSKNFKVIDAETAKKTIERDKLFHVLEGNEAVAAKIGLQYDAEIVIMGKATSTPSANVMGTRIKSVHTSISAKAIRTDNAEIIASGSVSAVKSHIDEATGMHMAFQNASGELADTLIGKILDKWKPETMLGTTEITISGLNSLSELIEIEKAIKQIARGVKDIHQRSFTSGVAKLEIKLHSDTQTLAETLVTQKMGNIQLDVTDVTENKIHAKVKE